MQSANNAVDAIKRENASADVDAMFVDLTSLITVQKFACSYISRNMYVSHSQYHLFYIAGHVVTVFAHMVV